MTGDHHPPQTRYLTKNQIRVNSSTLPQFPVASLAKFDAATLPSAGRRVAQVALDEHRTHKRRPTNYRTHDLRHVANIASALPALPDRGESWHIIAKGNTPFWQVIPRLIELAAEPIHDLKISTLGFGRDFAAALLDMLDTGQVANVGILCSHYFKSTSQGEYRLLADTLADRLAVVRCHAKVIAATMHSGRGFVFEGSGNLRSCRSIEQMTITQDAELTRFHQAWITELLTQAHGQKTATGREPH